MKYRKLFFILTVFLLGSFLFAFGIPEIAKKIKKGEIDVGKEEGMGLEQRFHRIHNEVLGIDCSSCHLEKLPEDFLYQRKYKELPEDCPGQVDRSICLGCHKEDGPAISKFYSR